MPSEQYFSQHSTASPPKTVGLGHDWMMGAAILRHLVIYQSASSALYIYQLRAHTPVIRACGEAGVERSRQGAAPPAELYMRYNASHYSMGFDKNSIDAS